MKTIVALLSFFFIVIMVLQLTESTMYMKHGKYLEPGRYCFEKA